MKGILWTPHDIEVFLHLATTHSEWVQGETSAYLSTVALLYKSGFFYKDSTRGESPPTAGQLTDAGRSFLRRLCSVPPAI